MTSLETATDAPSRAAQRKNAANSSAKPRGRSSKKKPCADFYTEVTTKIVKELEAGRFPWAQPWAARGEAATIAAGLPKNASTGRAYSGINILLLWGAAIENGFSGQVWLTFKQAVRRESRMKGVTYGSMSSVQLCRRFPHASLVTAGCEAGMKAQGRAQPTRLDRARRRSEGRTRVNSH